VQQRLAVVNEGWHAPSAVINPDGDANVDGSALDGFTMVDCAACGGILKPDVVYFGERVPATGVAHAQSAVADGQTLLILGSSLHVYSGRRFALQAAKAGIPIAIINVGPTRADDIATARIDAPLGQTLTALATALSGADVVPAG
jgi:NAD-dependent SIR2 family protein deacetylase